jgi:hypothetical protein
MELDAPSLVDSLAVRWAIETFFEDETDLLGSDQEQVMTATAILRVWTLTACWRWFLEEQRAAQPDQQAPCGDVRRALQAEHRFNLLRWLAVQFRSGQTVDQVRMPLAL